jgi:hypothetical protein
VSEPRKLCRGSGAAAAWVPDSCTLPTVQRPVRAADFDGFFAGTVRDVERTAPTRLRLELEPDPEAAARAARLAAAEVSCCSFFTFTLTASGQGLTLDISVPDAHATVLDALTSRVRAARILAARRVPRSRPLQRAKRQPGGRAALSFAGGYAAAATGRGRQAPGHPVSDGCRAVLP